MVEAPDRVRILIWERGVGPTHASGTGACAAAVAAIAHAGAARDVEVIAPGGTQRVEWRDDGVYLTGWAEVVFEGHWLCACRRGIGRVGALTFDRGARLPTTQVRAPRVDVRSVQTAPFLRGAAGASPARVACEPARRRRFARQRRATGVARPSRDGSPRG